MNKDTEKAVEPVDSASVQFMTDAPKNGAISEAIKSNLSNWSILAIGYNTSSSWIGLAISMTVAIASGGSVTLIYGVIIVYVIMFFVGLTLAELATVYPTAGGQYHFTSILAPTRWSRSISYCCGLATAFAWMAQAANICLFIAQNLFAVIMRWQGTFEPHAWQYFLVFELVNIVMVIYNIFLTGRMMWLNNLGAVLSLLCYLILTILCPVISPSRATSQDVWNSFLNTSGGWPNGIFFLIGLSTPQFSIMALDATLHMAEETSQPKRDIPKAVVATVLIGFFTGFTFVVALCYSFPNMQDALQSPSPIFYILEITLGSPAGATVLLVFFLYLGFVVLNATHQTASRVTWAFARDNGLIKSSKLATFHPNLHVPVYALLVNGLLVGLLGVIYLISSSVFNSLLGSATIVFQFTFAVPAALLILRRRSAMYLPTDRYFRLPHFLGYTANFITVAWAIIILILFCFPVSFPVTASNMNYASAVLAVMVALGIINWIFYTRKHYQGPRPDSRY